MSNLELYREEVKELWNQKLSKKISKELFEMKRSALIIKHNLTCYIRQRRCLGL